ncbi:flavin-dependent dehydrogenase [Pontibacter ummariensis]|uniref:Dehydrogenase (Flavoprotein) n=1 Tax=Pontibacter ummariensis TaxID=1610492 RepID=A0A239L0J9_9BACT|nr:NAD(P)/FAD-dependent oxidoreductase [Pontibacter ummariensis]PRY04630.1 flavin-dependent dehydrogenase [Pontibacter ummariensis]SNT23845.1 Dehydrogenase (flavoprotein) [Pontibacter ummariensis]
MATDVVIIGGGLAGLVSALGLAKAGLAVTLVEKKAYPFHKVCGEYVSNEVLPYLRSLGADVGPLKPANIRHFLLSSPSGHTLQAPLDLGGFGLSRYTFDNYLYELARKRGVNFLLQQQVLAVTFEDDAFDIELSGPENLQAKVVLGAFGKRANLDRQLERPFFKVRSPYIGVKYHLRHDFPKDLIALHNFKDGYAGISAIEDNRYCFCYLTTRQNLKEHGSIPRMEQAVLHRNPHLRQIFEEAELLYDQPEVINEISFSPKTCVENHMLLCGDAAGMITPLCGNGMAMAIHSGKIATEHVLHYFRNGHHRQELEKNYEQAWKSRFKKRLQLGRTVQQLFGNPVLSELAVRSLKYLPPAVRLVMRQTHGKPF